MRLAEIQRAFLESTLSENAETGAALVPYLEPAGQLTVEQALAVYRNNGLSARTRALAEAYPVLKAILSDHYFRQAARKYARSHRPDSADLNRYGESFAGFLDLLMRERAELNVLPYLSDLARLEWAWHRSFLATEPACFDLPAFAVLPQSEYETLRFVLHGSLSLLSSPYPVLEIWNEHRYGGKPGSVTGLTDPQRLVIAHTGDASAAEEVSPSVFRILVLIRQGKRFGALIDYEGSEHISQLIERKWIAGFVRETRTDHV